MTRAENPLIPEKIDTVEDSASREPQEPAISVVVHHPEGNLVRALRAGESLSIGRAAPADLVLPDDRLSRMHATLSWLNGKVVVTEDNLNDFLGVRKFDFGRAEKKNQVGQVVGLAWTEVGGDLLTIEAATMPGSSCSSRARGLAVAALWWLPSASTT